MSHFGDSTSPKQREGRMTQQLNPALNWGNTRHLWFSITEIDYTDLMQKLNFKELFSLFAAPIELLDIGCGSGRFPSILRQHLSNDYSINYDYLDPWEDKLVETEQALSELYSLRKRLCTSVESLDPTDCPADGYDLLWSMHSFYYVERDSLKDTLEKLRNLVKTREGIALIYLSSRDAFYNQFYELYLRQTGINGDLFVCAEEIVRALDSIGIESTILTVDTQHKIPLCDERLLERYIQGCAMKADAYQNVKSDKLLTDFVDSFKGPSHYQFPQSLKLIAFGSAKRLARITIT
jgi:SAM-dependent methyltransferase